MVERREARVPRHGTQASPLGCPARYVISAFTRVLTRYSGPYRMPLHPGACRRSAHPSLGWVQVHNPGAIASRERDWLFEIVRRECAAMLRVVEAVSW